MDNQYDSILKQKKTYDIPEPPKKKSKFKLYFFIDLLLIIIVLSICYIYYYNNVLSSKNIILNNSNILLKEYKDFFKYLNIDNLLKDGTTEGTLKLNNNEYKFNISKINNIISINLENNNEKINYFYNDNGIYYQIPSISNLYIRKTDKNKYKGLNESFNNITNKLDSKKEIKKLYLNNNKPTVEMNMNITPEDIKSILPYFFKNNYELILTIKNDALANNIINEKIVINNQTKNIRTVYQYENGIWTSINNESKITKYEINKKENMINIYHKDKLYSIIKYTKKEDKDTYNYQVIDEYYNLSLSITNNDNHYIYEFTSNIGENKESDSLIIELDKSTTNNPDNITHELDNKKSSDINKYKETEDRILKPLRDFIDKYKESINHINNY